MALPVQMCSLVLKKLCAFLGILLAEDKVVGPSTYYGF